MTATDDDPDLADRIANNVAGPPARVDQLAATIDDVNPDDTDDQHELTRDVERHAFGNSPLRAPAARLAGMPVPTPAQLAVQARWWARTLTFAALQVLIHLPQITWNQVPHVLRGIAIACGGYARYRGKGRWLEAAYAADAPMRAARVEKVEHAKRGATRLTMLALVLLTIGVTWALWSGRDTWVWTAGALALFALDLIGRRQAPRDTGVEIMPRSSFTEGAPTRMVVADVRAVLVEQGHEPERLAVVEPRVAEHGLVMKIHSPREIDESAVLAIERGLQTYRGAASIIGDPDNAALTELRLMWEDPLAASFVPLRLPPRSQTIADPAVLGYGLGGAPLELNFMRTNVVIVGAPGSGKSSTLWAIIDWLSVCRDARLWGIDLSGGPMLSAWGDVFHKRATDKATALAMLRELLTEAGDRTRVLAARSEPSAHRDGPPQSENWGPADGLFEILVIDELPLLSQDPDLCELLAEHQRVGRKAGVTSISATQDLSKETMGATSLRKYPSTVILHACSRDDVTMALGGGKVKEGWAPHRLTPAEGDAANDAGKCFISSGRHTRPVPWRMARLDDMGEIHSRAIERIDAGRPGDDDHGRSTVDGHVVPDDLAMVLAVFTGAGDPEFLPTTELLDTLNESRTRDRQHSGNDLAARLRRHGVEPERRRHHGSMRRGYILADLRSAAGLEGEE